MRRNSDISAATSAKPLTNIAVQEGAAASLPRAIMRSRNAIGRVTETLPTSETAQTKSATIRRATDSRMLRPIGGELMLHQSTKNSYDTYSSYLGASLGQYAQQSDVVRS